MERETFGENCFLSEIPILTCNGERKISELKIGEKVLGVADGNVVQGTVTEIFKRTVDAYYVVQTADREVRVTGAHPFLTSNGWKIVKDLAIGDSLVTLRKGHLSEEPILSKRLVSEKVVVFNMQVSEAGTYFAEGFAVHNKFTESWIENLTGALRGLFNSYLLLWSFRVGDYRISWIFVFSVILAVCLLATGLTLSRKK